MRKRDGLTRKERRQFDDLVRTFYEADESPPAAPGDGGEDDGGEDGADRRREDTGGDQR